MWREQRLGKFRLYCDTSIFGGCLDVEFALESRRLLRFARVGKVTILVSQAVLDELADAPERVRNLLLGIPETSLERIEITQEIITLQRAYLSFGVLTDKWATDALHVAAATLALADALVSWNFKHLVRLDKMKGFNAVNRKFGYNDLVMVSPKELQFNDRYK